MNMVQAGPSIGVFASDRGPGDPERASLMSQTGTLLARRGARLVCLAEGGVIPVPLITAARAAGGSVIVLADSAFAPPPALADLEVEIMLDRGQRLQRFSELTQVFVALPGSLASATALFATWTSAASHPLVMLNRHKAFDAVKGFATDVVSHSMSGYDRKLQFAESVEDLWNKIAWLLERTR